MSKPAVVIERLGFFLETMFSGRIDMSDCAKEPPPQKQAHFLSRALAAWCVHFLSGVDPDAAGASITDGYHDGGIDALHVDPSADRLVVVQSSFSAVGKTTIDAETTAKFVDGVTDLLGAKFERFNDKFRKREHEIRSALYRAPKIKIVTAHTSSQPLQNQALARIRDLVGDLNLSADPVAASEYFDQARIYNAIISDAAGTKIDLDIPLQEWGIIEKPFAAFYGRVAMVVVAKWWQDYGRALCARNIRHLLSNSEVNTALEKTLREAPENFWYFNNGITVVCQSVTPALLGQPGRKIGMFKCTSVSIVNGAQTVGTIGEGIRDPGLADTKEGWVQVRIISLDNAPTDFDRRITRATNFQNAVRGRDFAAMDPTQQRLATEFALDRRTYAYKSGDNEPQGEQGCSIVEATQALACDQVAVDLAVEAKREISTLWSDIDGPPYTDLFNERLTNQRVWRSVHIMRAVDAALQNLRGSDLPRADMVGIHLNRIILHLVFRDPRIRSLNHDNADLGAILSEVGPTTHDVFRRVAAYLQANHPNDYLASLCKNRKKCRALVAAVTATMATPDGQGTLF